MPSAIPPVGPPASVLKELLLKEHKDRDDYTDQLEELECGITKPEMLTMVDEPMAMRLEGTSHLHTYIHLILKLLTS